MVLPVFESPLLVTLHIIFSSTLILNDQHDSMILLMLISRPIYVLPMGDLDDVLVVF